MKKTFYTEYAYVIGTILLALSSALLVRADFGLSMVAAPIYVIHVKLSQVWSFFTFGTADYCFQALLLIALTVIGRKFKRAYVFSMIAAVIYGMTLDGFIYLLSFIGMESIVLRIVFFICGLVICSFSSSLLFEAYLPPEACALFVKEIATWTKFKISRVKTVYDCSSCLLAIILSFIFFGFGHFEGIGIGTVICALVNGTLIGKITAIMHRVFDFKDRFNAKGFFQQTTE